MITIKINDPGYTIKFPKINEVRTPCNINISEKDLKTAIIELKRLGIRKYIIVSNEESNKIKTKPKPIIKDSKVIIKEQIIKSEDYSNLEKRFGILEELLKQSLSRPSQIINKYDGVEDKEINSKDSIIEELDDFIPSIDLDGMEIKGSSFQTQQKGSGVKEASVLLSKMTKKYNKFKEL